MIATENKATERAIERLRGRRAVIQRRRRLAAEPLCRHCAALGRIKAATVPDHIMPLQLGGTDEDINIQCLCADCHDRKTCKDFGLRPKAIIDADGWPSNAP